MPIIYQISSIVYHACHISGEYRARALFSKTFSLREAAINKTQLMVMSCEMGNELSSDSISTLCQVIRQGVEDKIQQVLIASISLMDAVLRKR